MQSPEHKPGVRLEASLFREGDWISVGKRRARRTRQRGRVVKHVGEWVYFQVWDPIKKAFGRNKRANAKKDGVKLLIRN